MTLQNRVLPTGDIVADPARGLFTGNRGIIHRPDDTLGTARWSHKHWLICTLDHPRGRYHGPMPDRAWTALFFLDEAVALTAGHRPCHYCRRDAYHSFVAAWEKADGRPPTRMAMDTDLHRARVTRTRRQVRHDADLDTVPNHAFVLWQGQAHLVCDDRLLPHTTAGYGPPIPRRGGRVTVLSPKPTLGVLGAGYRPTLHPTARLTNG